MPIQITRFISVWTFHRDCDCKHYNNEQIFFCFMFHKSSTHWVVCWMNYDEFNTITCCLLFVWSVCVFYGRFRFLIYLIFIVYINSFIFVIKKFDLLKKSTILDICIFFSLLISSFFFLFSRSMKSLHTCVI